MSYGLFHVVVFAVTALVQSLDPTMEEFSVEESTALKPRLGPLAPACEQLNAACFFGLHQVPRSRPGVGLSVQSRHPWPYAEMTRTVLMPSLTCSVYI